VEVEALGGGGGGGGAGNAGGQWSRLCGGGLAVSTVSSGGVRQEQRLQNRADQRLQSRAKQSSAKQSSAKQRSASTHDQGPWQYQTPAPGSGTGTLALALANAGRQCIPSRWTRVPVSERATTRIMAAAGHGNGNANANGDCFDGHGDSDAQEPLAGDLCPFDQVPTYLNLPPQSTSPVPPLFSPPVTRPPLPLLLRSPIPPGLPRCCSADGGVQRE
jgi:hypothetical protein